MENPNLNSIFRFYVESHPAGIWLQFFSLNEVASNMSTTRNGMQRFPNGCNFLILMAAEQSYMYLLYDM